MLGIRRAALRLRDSIEHLPEPVLAIRLLSLQLRQPFGARGASLSFAGARLDLLQALGSALERLVRSPLGVGEPRLGLMELARQRGSLDRATGGLRLASGELGH